MTTKKNDKLKADFPAESAQGQQARHAGIAQEDAPYAEGDQLEAWQAGYDSNDDPYGAQARNETMTAEPPKAKGQQATAASAKKA